MCSAYAMWWGEIVVAFLIRLINVNLNMLKTQSNVIAYISDQG